jgi:hypothetical protein
VGAKLEFGEVLMIGDGDNINIGAPMIKGAKVMCEVVEHNRAAVRTLIEALPSPAVLLANDGAILATNQQAEALLLGEDGESWRLGLAQADERVVAQSVDLTGGHGRLVLLHSGEGTEEATAD